MHAAWQYEQAAADRSEVAVADATAQTQADMLHKIFRIEQVDETDRFSSGIEASKPVGLGGRTCQTWAKISVDDFSICRISNRPFQSEN